MDIVVVTTSTLYHDDISYIQQSFFASLPSADNSNNTRKRFYGSRLGAKERQ